MDLKVHHRHGAIAMRVTLKGARPAASWGGEGADGDFIMRLMCVELYVDSCSSVSVMSLQMRGIQVRSHQIQCV